MSTKVKSKRSSRNSVKADVSGSYSAEDMSKAWSEGYHRKVDEINGNELRYFDVWLANGFGLGEVAEPEAK